MIGECVHGVQKLHVAHDCHHYHHRRLLSSSFVIIFIVIIIVIIIIIIIIVVIVCRVPIFGPVSGRAEGSVSGGPKTAQIGRGLAGPETVRIGPF